MEYCPLKSQTLLSSSRERIISGFGNVYESDTTPHPLTLPSPPKKKTLDDWAIKPSSAEFYENFGENRYARVLLRRFFITTQPKTNNKDPRNSMEKKKTKQNGEGDSTNTILYWCELKLTKTGVSNCFKGRTVYRLECVC